MFKKPFSTGQSNIVGGTDRKKLRRALEKQFPALDEASLEAVLPNKAGELESLKLAAPRREHIYKLDSVPILVDVSGKMDLMPTIFTLWKVPHMVPLVHVKHPAVTTYIVSGADLMLPGVILSPEALPAFKKEGFVGVAVLGNPAPLAVGVAVCSRDDALAKQTGKLVEVKQVYGDVLWEMHGKRGVPNQGYLSNGVVPVDAQGAAMGTSSCEEDEEEAQGGAAGGEAAAAAAAAADAADAAQGDVVTSGMEQLAVQHHEEVEGQQGAATEVPSEHVQAPIEGQQQQSTYPEDMDELLEITLLQTLHRMVKDDTGLPLSSSALWNLMLSARPFGSTLDVKRSRHKKLGAFLKAYGGREGLLQLKEDKYSGDQAVVGVNRGHILLQDFRPYKAASMAGKAEAASPSPGGHAGGGEAGADELVVEEVFRPGRELKAVLDALSIPSDHLFTAAEAGDAAFQYVQAAQLTDPLDPGSIKLDVTLCDALFKGIIKKGELFPSHLPKAELRAAFLRRCLPQCRISRGNSMVVKKGALPAISINVEKRQGNKRVTRIVGVESFLIDPAAIASDCARRFAASCTTNELPGKTSPGQEIIIQGDVKEKVPAFLIEKFKIPKKYIEVKK